MHTLYVYLDSGTGRPARLARVSNLYRADVTGSQERAEAKTLEEAAAVACRELCKLHGRRQPSRVFVSRLENADLARRDPAGLVYTWRGVK